VTVTRPDGGHLRQQEAAAVLAVHGGLRCAPSVESGDETLTLTLTVSPDGAESSLQALELLSELLYLRDVCQLRRLAMRYGIPPEKLEAMLPDRSAPDLSALARNITTESEADRG